MFLNLAISLVLSAITESFKNPEKKAKLKLVLLNIRDQINNLYPETSI